ncbi:hypothetical protein GCM10022244_12570 [Streptomyces gulbargensis]|uniref:Transposase n=1 Tax=Streptomyces gulbargensis TaxID=364901 RepID=A0ABP7LMB2_9ACTN
MQTERNDRADQDAVPAVLDEIEPHTVGPEEVRCARAGRETWTVVPRCPDSAGVQGMVERTRVRPGIGCPGAGETFGGLEREQVEGVQDKLL